MAMGLQIGLRADGNYSTRARGSGNFRPPSCRTPGSDPCHRSSYELSDAEGRNQIETLRPALEALGVRVRVDVTPRVLSRLTRREERVALELQMLVAAHALRDPESTLARVPFVIARARARVDPYTANLLDAWSEIADAPAASCRRWRDHQARRAVHRRHPHRRRRCG